MLINYFKIALRNMLRNKTSSFVNIAGLTLGICAFLLLMEYISHEESVNKFHANLPQMYRLINQDPKGNTWPETEPGWADIFKQRFAEIKDACRFDEETGSTVVSVQGSTSESFSEMNTGYADGNFFSFFSFPLIEGSAQSLNKTNAVFMSKTTAKKYFGDAEALQKTLVVNNQFGKTIYTVMGVFADMQDNSDIRYNMLFSLETLKNPANLNGNSWAATDNLNSQYINTIFVLNKDLNIAAFENKLTAMRTQLKPDKDGIVFKLQAFKDIHLGSSFNDTYPTAANIRYVYMLGGLAFLILLIAWFNYVNLSTANSFKRANEVGVRKVIGASNKNLIVQFLGESFLINSIAFILAVALVLLMQPLFNTLVDKQLSLQIISNSFIWTYGLVFLLAGTLLSGAYTAFSLSRYKPVQTLKGKITSSAKGILLRKTLVVAQFSISIILIIATIIIYTQVHYMQNKELGLNPAQLVVIRGPQVNDDDSIFKYRKTTFENDLAAKSFIAGFCASGSIPGGNYNFTTSGFTQPNSLKGDELKSYSFAIIDNRFLNTYNIPLIAGRNFTNAECNISWNNNSKVLLNETAVKQLGFQNPEDALKTKIQWDERKLDVIGVVKDYNHRGAQFAVDPVIFYPQNNSSYFTVKLTPENINTKIADIEKDYKSQFAGNPFEYFFVDENFKKLYEAQKQYGDIFTAASVWAIFIACLGLFGLVTFTVESRTKEIGVRKVLGASVINIVSLLSKDFIALICVALVIAIPVAWWLLNNWLNNFAYRVSLNMGFFITGGLLAIIVAFLTICSRAIKAAVANPVKSLRTE